MRFLLVVPALILLPFMLRAQQDMQMKDGKVYLNDSVFCYYEKNGSRISTMMVKGPEIVNPLSHPEASGDEFKDVSFGNQYESFITAQARIFASIKEPFIVYYYNIRFKLSGKELNVRYHPLLMQSLAKDLIKYNVLIDMSWNEQGAEKLFNRWNRKSSVIAPAHLAKGVTKNYNSSITDPGQEAANTFNIQVQGDKIFRNDSLVAQYKLAQTLPAGRMPGTRKYDYLYRIEDTTGTLLALVRVPLIMSVFYLEPVGSKNPLFIVNADREEDKIICSAAKVLAALNKLTVR